MLQKLLSRKFDHSALVMSLKEHTFPMSPGTVLSVFCLLLYFAGFIRNESKFNEYERRLKTVEEFIPQDKMTQARTDFPPSERGNVRLSLFQLLHGCLFCGWSCSFKVIYVSCKLL